MKAEIAAKWVAKLRSGTFTQAHGALNRTSESFDARHCCLGVLCELAIEEGVQLTKYEKFSGAAQGDVVWYEGNDTYLPMVVQQWAGLRSHTGAYGPATEDTGESDLSLSEHNDNGMTFNQIADIIEANIEVL